MGRIYCQDSGGNQMSSTRLYRIICLKRSYFADMNDFEYHSDWYNHSSIVYWMPNAQGYTTDWFEAGLYTGLEIENINGKHLDWLLDPVTDQERFE